MQCGVDGEVDGAGGDSGIIVMDEQGVVSDLVTCCPPANDHLAGVDLAVKLVHVLGKVQLHRDLDVMVAIFIYYYTSFFFFIVMEDSQRQPPPKKNSESTASK